MSDSAKSVLQELIEKYSGVYPCFEFREPGWKYTFRQWERPEDFACYGCSFLVYKDASQVFRNFLIISDNEIEDNPGDMLHNLMDSKIFMHLFAAEQFIFKGEGCLDQIDFSVPG